MNDATLISVLMGVISAMFMMCWWFLKREITGNAEKMEDQGKDIQDIRSTLSDRIADVRVALTRIEERQATDRKRISLLELMKHALKIGKSSVDDDDDGDGDDSLLDLSGLEDKEK